MSTTDPSNDRGGTDVLEARLRHALLVVADSTPVTDPVPGAAPLPMIRPERPGDRSRPVWRIVAAAAVVLTIIGGVAVIAGQRDRTRVDLTPGDDSPEPTTSAAPVAPDYRSSDHWHEAYGFYVCDTFLAPVSDVQEDRLGLHTHGDGLVHIHPFSAESSGANAKVRLFGDQVGVEFLEDGWRLPNGDEYRSGRATCGGQQADVVVYRWSVGDPANPDGVGPAEVYTEGFGDIVFDADRQAYTFAVVPEGTVPPRPLSIPTLDDLTDVAPGTTGAKPG